MNTLNSRDAPASLDVGDQDVQRVAVTFKINRSRYAFDVVNPPGVKGVGEIGVVGVAAANANWHATGKRIRDLPITRDKVFA
ncbi:hypothetical protein [Paraburkholderia sp. D1E]|uniref:hypothetical protein n=1 Tax=Paraburkholderia sp. D1E TaxID=3461398 RepID=UPI0040456B8B